MKTDGLNGREDRLIWEGHRDRLRQRVEQEGWDALKPHEMVEIVLCHAMPRQDLSEVSRLLVDRFGSVGGIFRAPRKALRAVPGVTPGLAEWIRLTGALVLAYRRLHNISDIRLECYRQVKDFLGPLLPEKRREGLWVLYSDYDFNLITVSDLRESEIWWEAENVRRILMDAIGHDARYIYVVLWKDRPAAGLDDIEAARLDSIATMLCAAELDLVDCLLVNDREFYSMRIHGRMNRFSATAAGERLRERYGEE